MTTNSADTRTTTSPDPGSRTSKGDTGGSHSASPPHRPRPPLTPYRGSLHPLILTMPRRHGNKRLGSTDESQSPAQHQSHVGTERSGAGSGAPPNPTAASRSIPSPMAAPDPGPAVTARAGNAQTGAKGGWKRGSWRSRDNSPSRSGCLQPSPSPAACERRERWGSNRAPPTGGEVTGRGGGQRRRRGRGNRDRPQNRLDGSRSSAR